MSAIHPTFFVPHGAPTFALNPGEAGAALARMAAGSPAPRAIVIVSAHWDTEAPSVGFAQAPETIHDFRGFPAPLYDMRYPARGSREASEAVASALEAAGIGPVRRDPARGLDHGAWIPLRLMYPEGDVPVVPVSVQSGLGTAGAWRLGSALAPLVRDGFLVIGSGNLTHNLDDWRRVSALGSPAPGYVRDFPDWVAGRLDAGDFEALLDYRRQSPGGARAHPSEEHLLPFHVALGAAGEGARAERFHSGVDSGVIAMDAYAFHASH